MYAQYQLVPMPRMWPLLALALTIGFLTAGMSGTASTRSPKPKPGFPNTFTLTICEDEECATTDIGTVQAHIVGVTSSNTKAATAGEHGTNSVLIKGRG